MTLSRIRGRRQGNTLLVLEPGFCEAEFVNGLLWENRRAYDAHGASEEGKVGITVH